MTGGPSQWVGGWRLALRMAWREAWRAKGRSLLVLVMVTFPVVAVVAADIAQATAGVSSVEGLDRQIGSAQAAISIQPGAGRVIQTAAGSSGPYDASGHRAQPASLAQLEAALGGGERPVTRLRVGAVDLRTRLGVLSVDATGVDLNSPLARGLVKMTSGRKPAGPAEVVINGALAREGFAVGDTITTTKGTKLTVVGMAESADIRSSPFIAGSVSLPTSVFTSSWLVGGAPVSWTQVQAVNALGALVLSRAVVEHPPSISELDPRIRDATKTDHTSTYAVLGLVAAMALIEVVLLAGPAFAVGARRQSRSLALIAANGGTPVQSRRVILGSALVIGAVGAAAGIVLGILLGAAAIPALQSMSSTFFGPFQIRWSHLLGVGAFGLLSAFLAAVVPAWIASRQDIVAVLAGRRGDRAASKRSPFIGVALVVAGVVAAVLGAGQGSGEGLIAVAAILSIFGMIFLVPVVVLGVARLGRRLPLPLRYAVRDAARHRTRTVPAVAAVAATVAGVVALSIGNTSDQAQSKADYHQQVPLGESTIQMFQGHTDWAQVEAAVARVAPSAKTTEVVGVRGASEIRALGGKLPLVSAYQSPLEVQALVSDGASVPEFVRDYLPAAQWRRAAPVLRRGGVVLFGSADAATSQVRLVMGDPGSKSRRSVTVPAVVVGVPDAMPVAMGILSPPVARALHLPIRMSGLLLTGAPLTPAQSDDLGQVLTGLNRSVYLYTERGYEVPNSEKVVLWILFGLAGLLMLGGTLTATFLALADARPDLATLSAVGASPGTRRAVAAGYAVSVGVVGAVLGAAVGFVPGIAISYPLTRSFDPAGPSHYLSIPWLEIVGLVVALPLITALVVGLLARSRLPLVARLD